MQLRAGSPIARAAYRLWLGDPVVVLDTDSPLAAACDLVRWLLVDARPGTQVAFMAPPGERKRLGQWIWPLLREQVGIWEVGWGAWRDNRALEGPPRVVLGDWTEGNTLPVLDLLIIEASAPVVIPDRQPCPQVLIAGVPTSGQLEAAAAAVHTSTTRGRRAARWGAAPFELTLAGAPS